MIFDSLAHVTENGKWFDTSHNASTEKFEKELKNNNVQGAIISGSPDQNDFCYNYCKDNHRYELYFAPAIMEKDLDNLEEFTKKYQAKLFKIHPRWLNADVDSKKIQDVFAFCEEKKIKILLCTVFNRALSISPTHTLAKISSNFSDLKVIFVHGGHTNLLSVAESIRSNENVFLDLSFTLSRYFDSSLGLDINYLIRNFDKRICIGTDFPENSYSDVFKAVNYLNHDIEELKEKGILGKNIFEFLKIE